MGRNKLKPEEKRVNMLITVSQETRDKLQKHPKPAGRVIEELIDKNGRDDQCCDGECELCI